MKIIQFIIRLLVGYIGFSYSIFGLCLLIFVGWCLKSIQLIATISLILFGLLLTLNGLIGIYGCWQRHSNLLRLFLFLIILTLSLEIGTFTSLTVARVNIGDLVEQGWMEINEYSRNYIQKELKCCGLTGLSEYAQNLDPIDESCYIVTAKKKLFTNNVDDDHYNHQHNNITNVSREPYRVGCKSKLIRWIEKQTKTFIISTAIFMAFQIISVILVTILLRLWRSNGVNNEKIATYNVEEFDEDEYDDNDEDCTVIGDNNPRDKCSIVYLNDKHCSKL